MWQCSRGSWLATRVERVIRHVIPQGSVTELASARVMEFPVPQGTGTKRLASRLRSPSFGWTVEARALRRSVALAVHQDVAGAVDQTVEDRLGQDRVGEELMPVPRRPVGNDDGRASPVTLEEELVEVFRLLGRQAPQAEVVEDEKVGPEVGPQALLPRPVGVAAAEVSQKSSRLGVANLEALLAGQMPESLGYMSLADADGAAEEHRLAALQETQGGQVADDTFRDLEVVAEVELGQGLDLLELSLGEPAGEGLLPAAIDFTLKEGLEEGEVADPVPLSFLQAQFQGVEHPPQPQGLEFPLQVVGEHAPSTRRWSNNGCLRTAVQLQRAHLCPSRYGQSDVLSLGGQTRPALAGRGLAPAAS